jgi:CheY-like chemotaxis protein
MSRSAAVAAGRQPSILIVDDDAEMAALLCDVFEREGFRTVAETCASQALASAEREGVDLVIVDKQMPDIDGLELTSALRTRFPGLRSVLLTAFGGALVERAARERGIDHYMDKPVRLDALIETVRGLLGRSRTTS